MFTYLNFCPSKISKFYKDLIFEGSTKDIILSTINIIKRKRNAEKETAINIWNMIDEQLNQNHKNLNYKKIEMATLGLINQSEHCSKETCSEFFRDLGLFSFKRAVWGCPYMYDTSKCFWNFQNDIQLY